VNFLGSYNGGYSYSLNDAVFEGDLLYQYIVAKDNTSGHDPATSPAFWTRVPALGGYVWVVGQLLKDSTNTFVNGTISFAPVTNSGVSTSFRAGAAAGGGNTTQTAVSTTVSSGKFMIKLADTSLTSPVNVGYAVKVTDAVTGDSLLGSGYGCIQPVAPSDGDVWNFDLYAPIGQPGVTITSGPSGLSAYQLWLASGHTGSEADYEAFNKGAPGDTNPNFVQKIVAPYGIQVSEGATISGNLNTDAFRTLKLTKPYTSVVIQPGPNGRPLIASCVLPDGTPYGYQIHDPRIPVATSVDASSNVTFPGNISAGNVRPVVLQSANTRAVASGVVDQNNRLIPAISVDVHGNPVGTFPTTSVSPVVIGGIAPITHYEEPAGSFVPQALAKQMHLYMIYGESLGAGGDSYPIITTTQPFQNVMFNTDGSNSFSPLVGGDEGGGVETCANGFADRLSFLMSKFDINYRSCMLNGSVGGQTYSTLCKGTANYTAMLAQYTKAVAICTSLGLTYDAPAVILFLGYNDGDVGTTTAQFAADLIQLQKDMQADIQAIVGSNKPIPFFHFATQYEPFGTLQACLQSPDLHTIFASAFQFQGSVAFGNTSANSLHLSPYDERYAGELAANAVYDRILQNRYTTQILLNSYSIKGKTLTLNFRNSFGPLVPDNTYVTDPITHGIRVNDVAGANIESVTFSGSTITITFDRYVTVSGGSTLGIGANLGGNGSIPNVAFPGTNNPGWNGVQRTDIRDSRQGSSYYPYRSSVNGTNITMPMYRYIPSFTITY
jgi:hypothetical protein